MSARTFGALLLLATSAPAALFAQQPASPAIATGAYFQGYDFDAGLPVEGVNLFIVPVGVELPLGSRVGIDVYSAYAHGAVKQDGVIRTLSGVVDTRLRGSFTLAQSTVLTFGLNLPTGQSTHDAGEALVASALSSDLLGFREANFGIGTGVTTGIATATRLGEWGLGLGGSYRYSGGFEPRADTGFTYTPGDEIRGRLALDRTVAGNKLTIGAMVQHFGEDQVDDRDLFRSGLRVRGDLAYGFRTSATATWQLYLADIWRESGDLRLDLVDGNNAVIGDSTINTPSQNLLIAGVGGAFRIGNQVIRPSLDGRLLTREKVGGTEGGDGWLVGFGLDAPVRALGRFEIIPRGRIAAGAIDDTGGEARSFWGGEVGGTLRWQR